MFPGDEVSCGSVVGTTVLPESQSDYPTEEAQSFEGTSDGRIDQMRGLCLQSVCLFKGLGSQVQSSSGPWFAMP